MTVPSSTTQQAAPAMNYACLVEVAFEKNQRMATQPNRPLFRSLHQHKFWKKLQNTFKNAGDQSDLAVKPVLTAEERAKPAVTIAYIPARAPVEEQHQQHQHPFVCSYTIEAEDVEATGEMQVAEDDDDDDEILIDGLDSDALMMKRAVSDSELHESTTGNEEEEEETDSAVDSADDDDNSGKEDLSRRHCSGFDEPEDNEDDVEMTLSKPQQQQEHLHDDGFEDTRSSFSCPLNQRRKSFKLRGQVLQFKNVAFA